MHILNRKDLGNQLRAWRIAKGVTMIEIEEALHISKKMIPIWENGLEYPTQDELDKLCTYYGKETITITPQMRKIAEGDHLKEFLKEMKNLYFLLEEKNWTHMPSAILDTIYGNLPIDKQVNTYKEGLRNIGFTEIEERHDFYIYGFRCKTEDGEEYFIEFLPSFKVVIINENESSIEMNTIQEQLEYVKHSLPIFQKKKDSTQRNKKEDYRNSPPFYFFRYSFSFHIS